MLGLGMEGLFAFSRAVDDDVANDIVDGRSLGRVGAHAERDKLGEGRRKRREVDVRKVVGPEGVPGLVAGGDNDVGGRLEDEETEAEKREMQWD